jgi:hypothetical protein
VLCATRTAWRTDFCVQRETEHMGGGDVVGSPTFITITTGNKMFIALQVLRQCPLVLVVKVG